LRQPESIKEYLNRDQFRLYQLVWQRFVASQMNPAIFDTLSVDVTGKTREHEYLLRASRSSVRFPGYRSLTRKLLTRTRNPMKMKM
jgi:DNA topoisomerase-1